MLGFGATVRTRITQIAIAWLVAAVLFATPFAVIASCDTGTATATPAAAAIDAHEFIALDAADRDAPGKPCQQIRPISLDGAPTPAQRLPDNALIEAIGSMDRHAAATIPSPILELFPGLSPPPESPPPQSFAAR
jgi:hypothetical protein